MANSLNLDSANYYIFTNLSMTVYMREIQKSKFVQGLFREFDQSEPKLLNLIPCIFLYPKAFNLYSLRVFQT